MHVEKRAERSSIRGCQQVDSQGVVHRLPYPVVAAAVVEVLSPLQLPPPSLHVMLRVLVRGQPHRQLHRPRRQIATEEEGV